MEFACVCIAGVVLREDTKEVLVVQERRSQVRKPFAMIRAHRPWGSDLSWFSNSYLTHVILHRRHIEERTRSEVVYVLSGARWVADSIMLHQ